MTDKFREHPPLRERSWTSIFDSSDGKHPHAYVHFINHHEDKLIKVTFCEISLMGINLFIVFYYGRIIDCRFQPASFTTLYSSSPKKTLTGSQPSPQTLKRSGRLLKAFMSSAESSKSSSKFFWILDSVTDFGMTEVPR